MFLILNYSVIIKFYIIETEIILIKKTGYFKYYLNTEADNIYKINIYIFIYLNEVNITEILNIYQKLSILKENNIIIYNIISNIICNAIDNIIYNIIK